MEFNKGSVSIQRWPCHQQAEVASLQKTKVQQTKQTIEEFDRKKCEQLCHYMKFSVQRRASGAQALAAKRKTKSSSQKFHCYRAFKKETIGIVYNPKICPEIYEDDLVSGDRWEVRQCFQKVFIFFKSWIWLASRIFCLQAKERSWKYWGVWGEKEANLGQGKERLVFFIILRHFYIVLNHFFKQRIWRLKSKVDGVWLRRWPGKKGTWISWPA